MPKSKFSFFGNKAFTLLEIMLVVAIIAISTGIAIPSFTTFINTQGLKQGAEQVKSDLRSIQTNALANQVLPEMEYSDRIYWGMLFLENDNKYYVFATEDSVTQDNCESYIDTQRVFYLPSKTLSFGNYCVIFDSLNGNNLGSNFVALQSSNGSLTECLKINSFGLVSDGEFDSIENSCN